MVIHLRLGVYAESRLQLLETQVALLVEVGSTGLYREHLVCDRACKRDVSATRKYWLMRLITFCYFVLYYKDLSDNA